MLDLLSPIYSTFMQVRNALYDRRVLDSFGLGARTISIGNLTTGGTGKTPLTAHVAQVLLDRGERVCVLSRGYGREDESVRVLVSDGTKVVADAKHGGDEPVEIAERLSGRAIVIAGADRVASAEWAMRKFTPTVFVLDDAFQHRRVRRDVDVVCIDAVDPFGGGKVLPAGRLREKAANLTRADAIVIMGAGSAQLSGQVADAAPDAKVFHGRKVLSRIRTIDGGTENTASRSFFAFCALARPQSFFDLIGSNETTAVAGTKAFRDHHSYSQTDIDSLEKAALSVNANALITTAKDAVKLTGLKFGIPCYVAEIELEIDKADELAALL